MGKWKSVIPIVLALVIALAGTVFLYKWLKMQSGPKEVVQVESEAVPVAVTTVDLPWGTKLKKEMVKTVPFLKESLPTGYCSDPGSLEGRVLIAPLKQNEPIIEARLAPTSVTVGGVSAIVTVGKRAIAVKGDKVIGLSGFILPGNRVDVLVTMTNPANKREITKIVLDNILVLATGTQIQENGKGKPAPVDVYTLEVTPGEGEKLALAATQGRLQFALRNVTDAEPVLTRGATIPQTLASLKANNPTPQRTLIVEVIRGDKVSKKKLKL